MRVLWLWVRYSDGREEIFADRWSSEEKALKFCDHFFDPGVVKERRTITTDQKRIWKKTGVIPQ